MRPGEPQPRRRWPGRLPRGRRGGARPRPGAGLEPAPRGARLAAPWVWPGRARPGPNQSCTKEPRPAVPGRSPWEPVLGGSGRGRAAGLEAEDRAGATARGSQLAGDTGGVTRRHERARVTSARPAVPAQAPCRGENATARPPGHFSWSAGVPTR